jgi:hypothetical protein
MATYSEEELAHKALILRRCFVTEEDVQIQTTFFEESNNTTYTYGLYVIPVGRCSDKKFRGFHDYIDFLFPDKHIDELVEASNTPDRMFTTTLNFSTRDGGISIIATRN